MVVPSSVVSSMFQIVVRPESVSVDGRTVPFADVTGVELRPSAWKGGWLVLHTRQGEVTAEGSDVDVLSQLADEVRAAWKAAEAAPEDPELRQQLDRLRGAKRTVLDR